MMHVTAHAIDRFLERIDPRLTRTEARDVMLTAARGVDAAAKFGCSVVRLSCGAKLKLEGDTVVTVLPAQRPYTGHGSRLSALAERAA